MDISAMVAFGAENTHIYHAGIGDMQGVALPACWSVLNAAEQARAERFRFDIHRNRYIRAHGVLRHILARYMNVPADQLFFETGERGKPFLRDGGLYFNMSHSADMAAYAISREGEIGIDIEMFDRKVEIDDLSRHYYTTAEQGELAVLDEQSRRSLFFHLWTAKEARMKVTGEGLALDPREIDVEIEGGQLIGYRRPEQPKAGLQQVALAGVKGACSVAALFDPRAMVKPLELITSLK
jgi:4'-phosphopantetheinyl transferase|tara:strand:+ start:1306 stop:2022 length:717 start_codon:yes stop_codon:yes gene_type:complete